MVGLLIFVLVLSAVGVAGWLFGADSRDGEDWRPYAGPRGNQAGIDAASVTSGGTAEGSCAGWAR
jgi:hypothetical protein